MDVNLSIPLLLAVLVSTNSVSPLTLQTEDVMFKRGDSIVLNCTYRKDIGEDIPHRNIRWQKQTGDYFKDIAVFSHPGGHHPFIAWYMWPLYSNRTELIDQNNSPSAVLIIKEALCSDQGIYRCWIEYVSYPNLATQTSRTLVTFNAKPLEPREFLVFPIELEENQYITLTCTADVGSPLGSIQLWKYPRNSNISELVYSSNASINHNTENCTELINFNVTYTVTRDDNGAFYRCSSQNNLTQGQGLSRDSSQISVIYGPDNIRITLIPSKAEYAVGDSLKILCSADSNPPPTFSWNFRPYNKSEEVLFEHSPDISMLVFDSLDMTDYGTYICTATNGARLNHQNVTAFVSVSVGHSTNDYQGCSQCGYFRVCQLNNGKTVCVINTWVPISIVFIFTCASFAVATIILINDRRKWPKPAIYSNVTHSQSAQHNGGYQTHFDVTNTHIYSALQSIQSEGGEYASIENVSQLQESSIRQFK